MQVVHVTGPESIEQAERAAEHVHAILLDSGNPNLKVKELGGTGRRHDWTLSARIRERVGVPVLLAGGLTPDNAAEALATVRPYALDACTGLRGPGFALDAGKLARFAAAINAAPRRLIGAYAVAAWTVRDAARRWRDTWERGWRDHDSAAIVALYAEGAVFQSHPFRSAQAPADYIEPTLAAEESTVMRVR